MVELLSRLILNNATNNYKNGKDLKNDLHVKKMKTKLMKTAHEKNAQLTESERSKKAWKIVGGRGNRRLMLADV